MIGSKKTFKLIFVAGFLLALGSALPAYIQSSFLGQYLSIKTVSIFFTMVMAITLTVLLIYPRIINKLTNLSTMLTTSVVAITTLLMLGITKNSLVVLILFTIQYITLILLIVNLDIALETISDDANTGGIRGKYLSILNIGWLISPLVMGFIVNISGFQTVYLISGILILLNTILIYSNRKLLTDHKHYHVHKLSNLFKSLNKNKDLRKIFSLSFALRLFYCLMVLYTPIYLNQNIGLSWNTMSIIFTVMLLPFVLFGIPAGKIADRWLGEKEIMITGILLMSSTTLAIFFITSKSAVIWACLLFFGRVGAAIFETMQESYFFKHVDGNDLDLMSLFRDLRPFAWLIGTAISALILHWLPVQYIFVFLGIMLLFSFYPALTIKDTK